ncbi:MAG TPA: hypothetical protein VHK89_03520 [Actinomycetota bacterium]|nr:hypothetical protein [Actinomycetota bacterium]
MDPMMGADGVIDNAGAMVATLLVLVAVFLIAERMLSMAASAADRVRGRDRCHFCGAPLPSRDGLGYEARCRSCERSQPWA